MLEVEDWTQPSHSSKRRSAKRASTSPHPSEPPTTVTTPEPTPGLPNPDPEVEEPFPLQSPTSSALVSRGRGNSLTAAGPSSLSRLLAQAPVEVTGESAEALGSVTPPVASLVQPPPSPVHSVSTQGGPPTHRPTSRASRLSNASRLSAARIPLAGIPGSAKAVATTALAADQGAPASPSSAGSAHSFKSAALSVSPEGSPSEGMTNFLAHHRRRVTSYHPSWNSPLAAPMDLPPATPTSPTITSTADAGFSSGSARNRLASLASTFGVPFGRTKRLSGPSNSVSATPGTASKTSVTQEHLVERD